MNMIKLGDLGGNDSYYDLIIEGDKRGYRVFDYRYGVMFKKEGLNSIYYDKITREVSSIRKGA